MKHIFLSIAVLLLSGSLSMQAADRSKVQMQNIAKRELAAFAGHGSLSANVRQLYTMSHLSVFGDARRGFVVVTHDDDMPSVIGISDNSFAATSANPEFRWWLSTMNEQLKIAHAKGVVLRFPKPDTSLYPDSVAPIVKTAWGQDAPFNDHCPYEPTHQQRTPTGCVATALSQVMYYYHWPVQPHGQASVVFSPSGSSLSQTYSADFNAVTFRWQDMLQDYKEDYTTSQGEAVSQLMYNVGVGANMIYDVDGSGTTADDAVYALHNYFDYPQARAIMRLAYKDAKWMDMIYNELLDGCPIVYNAVDASMGGHSFVLDGYRADGKVHINWGWDGNENGWFDLPTLNVGSYSFNTYQHMIIGMRGQADVAGKEQTVTVSAPGTLSSLITPADGVASLHVRGTINAADFKTLRALAGRDGNEHRTAGVLTTLDLSGASLVGDSLPSHALSGLSHLCSVVLPSSMRIIGNGTFARDLYLRNVEMPAKGNNFVRIGQAIYSSDTTNLITVLPSVRDSLVLPGSVDKIAPEALSGCCALRYLEIPGSVSSLGDKALEYCYGLGTIKMDGRSVPKMGTDVLSEVPVTTTKLYVHGGCKNIFAQDDSWGSFVGIDKSSGTAVAYDNIVEYGTKVTVRNAVKTVGEANPTFGFEVEGEALNGTPEITCEATETSPAGVYPIHVSRGTITNEDVDFVDGKLTVVVPTGIKSVRGDVKSQKSSIYTTDGISLRSLNGKGLYIVNGHKVLK